MFFIKLSLKVNFEIAQNPYIARLSENKLATWSTVDTIFKVFKMAVSDSSCQFEFQSE